MEKGANRNPWIIPSIIVSVAIVLSVVLYKVLPERGAVTVGGGSVEQQVEAPASAFPEDLTVISYTQAPQHIGEEVIVEGKVVRIGRSKKGTFFLNFCFDWKKCPFTGVIFASNAHLFPNIRQFEGKKVRIWGVIKTYKGRPEIILDSPTQIQIVD